MSTLKNNSLIILTLFNCLISSSFFFVVNAEFEAEDKTYSYVVGADNGPENWGNLNFPNWTLCGNGINQSPINIIDNKVVVWPLLGDLITNYKAASAVIKNRGHVIEVEWRGDAGGVTINGTAYKLEQCHWHIPSEHTINGVRFDMEMHIVHISSKGDIAVVSILYKLGSPDSFLARLLPHLENANREGTDVGVLDPLDIKFEGGEYYRYTGSLTTPPCSETATWTIIKTARTVSLQQITALRDAVDNGYTGNARPIQPVHERTVYLFRP
ncbi:hypothetical protein ABFX02_10G162366 [Erythranthe guttata]